MSRMHTRATLTAIAASVLLSACATAGATYRAPHGANREQDQVQVAVTNNNWMDMDVYALRGSARQFLGTVTSMTSRLFTVPKALNVTNSDLRLMADPIGSPSQYVSDPIIVEPGSRIVWSLENQLTLSSYRVVGLNDR